MENLNLLLESLYLIKPELVVSFTLVAIVIVDLIFMKNKRFLPYVALIGLAISVPYIAEQFWFKSNLIQNGQNLVSVDPFGAFFKLIVVFSSILIVLFSLTSNEVKESFERHGEYYTLIFGMIIGMFFMISASDFIIIYIALELVSLSSYILAGFTKTSLRNSEASLKYVIYGAVSSGIMLFGISIMFGLFGTTNLAIINSMYSQNPNQLALILATILIFAGMGYKISAAPFHFWTPDVYEGAPITITAYLSIASKAAGFALLIRFIYSTFLIGVDANGVWSFFGGLNWKLFLTIISVLTMTLGNFAALWQDNIKRMLAYSSIAHAGYLLLGLATLSDQGLAAMIIYFAIYAIMNLGAFLVVMLIANKTGSENIEDYKGLGFATPFLSICLGVFLVSLTGLPPTAGFIGKLYLFIALVDAQMITLAVIALLNSVVSLYYYVRVLKFMFLNKPDVEEATWSTNLPNKLMVAGLASLVIIFGLYFTPLAELAKNSVFIVK